MADDISTPSPRPLQELPSSYRLRPAIHEDLSGILKLLSPYIEQELLLKRTAAETAALIPTGFVAEHFPTEQSIELIGFCAVEIYSKKLSEIQCLAVAEGHKRFGIGGHLVRHCVDLARSRGVMEVMAISSSESFLQGLGFDYSLPNQKRALFCQLRSRAEFEKLQ